MNIAVDSGTVAGMNALMLYLNKAWEGQAWWEAIAPLVPLLAAVGMAFATPEPGKMWYETLVRGIFVGLASMGSHAGGKHYKNKLNPGVLK